jgi:hypothetical protein
MPKKREYIAISGYIVDSHLYPKGEQVIAALDDGVMIDHAALSAESTSLPPTLHRMPLLSPLRPFSPLRARSKTMPEPRLSIHDSYTVRPSSTRPLQLSRFHAAVQPSDKVSQKP